MAERLSDKNPCKLLKEGCRWRGKCDKRQLWVNECIDKLTEYETAEDEGRLVALPCDTVYFIYVNKNGRAHVRAKSILDLYLHETLGIDRDGRYWSAREEAEKSLKGMEGKHE